MTEREMLAMIGLAGWTVNAMSIKLVADRDNDANIIEIVNRANDECDSEYAEILCNEEGYLRRRNEYILAEIKEWRVTLVQIVTTHDIHKEFEMEREFYHIFNYEDFAEGALYEADADGREKLMERVYAVS